MMIKLKDIVFIEPCSPDFHVYKYVTIPRLGTILLGTILKEQGYNVKIFVEDVAPINYKMIENASLVGISTITPTAKRAYKIAAKIKQMGIPLVMGGTHPTFCQSEALNYADYIVRNEGEETLVELVHSLENNNNLESILGLSYVSGKEIHENPQRPISDDLDRFPIPDFSLVHGWKTDRIISIETSRGCPHNCTFCSVTAAFGRKVRYNSVERVLEKLSEQNAKHVFFCDDLFSANRNRVKNLLNNMIDCRVTPEWSAQVRVDIAKDEEILELMRRSNCFAVFVGFESISPETLKAYDKAQSLEMIEHGIKNFHKYNINVHGMFVFGSDSDNVAVIRDTAKFARRYDLGSVQFAILTPFHGTRIREEFTKDGRILLNDWDLYNGHHVVYEPKNMTPYELQIETLKALKKFYSYSPVIKRLLRGDFYYAFMKLYARKIVKKWQKLNRDKIRNLKLQLRKESMKLLKKNREGAITRVGLVSSAFCGKYGPFWPAFFENLNFKVIVSPVLNNPDYKKLIEDQISWLKDKVDCLAIPTEISKDINLESIWNTIKYKVETLPDIIHLKINPEEKPLFVTCTRIGLALGKKISDIRKAYHEALKQVELFEAMRFKPA